MKLFTQNISYYLGNRLVEYEIQQSQYFLERLEVCIGFITRADQP